jgi:hypothetical protein
MACAGAAPPAQAATTPTINAASRRKRRRVTPVARYIDRSFDLGEECRPGALKVHPDPGRMADSGRTDHQRSPPRGVPVEPPARCLPTRSGIEVRLQRETRSTRPCARSRGRRRSDRAAAGLRAPPPRRRVPSHRCPTAAAAVGPGDRGPSTLPRGLRVARPDRAVPRRRHQAAGGQAPLRGQRDRGTRPRGLRESLRIQPWDLRAGDGVDPHRSPAPARRRRRPRSSSRWRTVRTASSPGSNATACARRSRPSGWSVATGSTA